MSSSLRLFVVLSSRSVLCPRVCMTYVVDVLRSAFRVLLMPFSFSAAQRQLCHQRRRPTVTHTTRPLTAPTHSRSHCYNHALRCLDPIQRNHPALLLTGSRVVFEVSMRCNTVCFMWLWHHRDRRSPLPFAALWMLKVMLLSPLPSVPSFVCALSLFPFVRVCSLYASPCWMPCVVKLLSSKC